jgi:hypothetical protein
MEITNSTMSDLEGISDWLMLSASIAKQSQVCYSVEWLCDPKSGIFYFIYLTFI